MKNTSFWIFLFCTHIFLRLSLIWTDFFDIDESQFAGFAHVLMDGGKPYLHSLDTKPLGIYYFFWMCFEFFGRHAMWAVHGVSSLWTFTIALFLYKFFLLVPQNDSAYKNLNQSDLNRQANLGRVASLLFVVFSTCYLPKFISTSITSVMVPLLVMAFYFSLVGYLKHQEESSSFVTFKHLFWDALSGVLVGIAFLFKYQAGIQTVHYFILSCLLLLQSRRIILFVFQNFVFGLFFVMPFLLHNLYLKKIGVWDDFIQWSVLGSQMYIADGQATSSFLKFLFVRFGSFVAVTWPLWYLSVLGSFQCGYNSVKKINFMTLLWLGLSFIPVCVGGRFYAHYYLQILPALCLLGALGWQGVSEKIRKYLFLSTGIFVLLFWILRLDYQTYLKYFPNDELYEQKEVGLYLKTLSKPDDKIYVWGFATLIYYYSEMKPASRFLWSDWQTGRALDLKYFDPSVAQKSQKKYGVAWQKLTEDLNNAMPRFFVDTSPANIHDYKMYPPQAYPDLKLFLDQNYQKVATVLKVDIYERVNR